MKLDLELRLMKRISNDSAAGRARITAADGRGAGAGEDVIITGFPGSGAPLDDSAKPDASKGGRSRFFLIHHNQFDTYTLFMRS